MKAEVEMVREPGEGSRRDEQVPNRFQVEEGVGETADRQTPEAVPVCRNLTLIAERDHYKSKCRFFEQKVHSINNSTTYRTGDRIRSLVYGPLAPVLDRIARRDYIRKMADFPVLSEEFSLRPVSLDVPTRLACCNPSIVAATTGWVTTVRTHNLRPLRDGIDYQLDGDELVNENWLLRLNEDLTVADRQTIAVVPGGDGVDADSLHRIAGNGLEDLRLFMFGGVPYALASAVTSSSRTNTMTLCRFLGARLDVLEVLASPLGETREKNWMPVVTGNRVYAVYSVNPFILLELGSGAAKVAVYRPTSPQMPRYSGSSQLLPYMGGWLCVVHRRSSVSRRHYYVHRFITFNPDWSIGAMSPEFFIEKRGIEFCAGIASKGDQIILSYGVRDTAARVVELSSRQIQNMLIRIDRRT